MKINDYEVKEGLLYSDNFWVRQEGNTATVGMTDYAAKQAKDIAFVELPKKGGAAKRGEGIGNVESSKWSGEIISPVSGKIIEINRELEVMPELINKDTYGKGWIAKIQIEKKEELKSLMNAKKYSEYIKKETE